MDGPGSGEVSGRPDNWADRRLTKWDSLRSGFARGCREACMAPGQFLSLRKSQFFDGLSSAFLFRTRYSPFCLLSM